jgi:gliding motility-associated-like protein
VVGTINLHLTAVNHVDTCAPINPCLSNANFQKQFDCTTSSAVRFINYSTFGSSISYLWDFGYAGQTSTAVSPTFTYPALTTAQTYTITLTVTNNTCNGVSTYTDNITIPPRPGVNLGADTSLCNGGSIMLDATSHAGATYLWNNGSTNPTFTVTTTGQNNYWVAVTYNGCVARDTIRVNIDPIIPQTQNLYICGANATTLNSSRGLGESHNWSTGATSPSINVFSPGTYWNDIVLRGCITRDSFIVSTTASSLGIDRAACFASQPVVLNATTAGATGYTWQNGTTAATFNATTPGIYWVDVAFGNCTLRDSITLSSIQPIFNSMNASLCQGQTYTLPSGTVVNSSGIYSDTTRTSQGCDSLINSVTLSVQSVTFLNSTASICSGQSYTLPWGTVVNSTGIYRDTLRYASGCDSLYRIVNLIVQQPSSTIINAGICSGQTYTLPSGVVVSTAGIYADTLYYNSGCDSLYRTVNLSIQIAQIDSSDAIICSGQTYTLPWGTIVSSPGVYRDTLSYIFGCDSLYRIINLTVQIPQSQNLTITICNGQSYTLPSGVVVIATGIYQDTLRYTSGCDSLRSTINLLVQSTQQIVSNDTICAGQTYTLPWGTIVSSTGTYSDTLSYVSTGCDSLYTIVNLTVQSSAVTLATNTTICSGQSYTLPWGNIVSTSGIYTDTIRYAGSGCDSLYTIVDLIVQPAQSLIIDAGICSGQSYTLPWGTVITVPGIYKDTLHYTSGCDSLYRTVNLNIQNPQSQTLNPVICAGQSYTLPGGNVVNNSGIYNDTLYYLSGCDSLYSTVNLTVQTSQQISLNDTICAGQAYILPWGAVVNNSGIYRDTIRYISTGCDSLYNIVDLFVLSSAITTTTDATICNGQSYTLPWGNIASASGTYIDTIQYVSSGCDSLYNIVNLTVQTTQTSVINASICSGQNYTLPSGAVVNTSGIYRDTLSYSITGCDSLYRTVNLTVQSSATVTLNPTICAGQTYTLPSGITISTTGVYNDTARYTTGCDSLYTTINLTVLPVSTLLFNPVICSGQTYTTQWGMVVSSSGTYRDTLRYLNGCDSVYRIVNLIVQSPTSTILNPVICSGQNYTLPWGAIANTTGVYGDTLRYASGCDSLYRVINLTVQSSATAISNPVICSGQTYTLPWGTIANTTGIYRDTLRYIATNCDSLYRIVNLSVQSSSTIILNPAICAGQTYTLPWGAVVNATGVYRDTLRYINTGCDSVYRIVDLTVQSPVTTTLNPIICAGLTYTLPWGAVVNATGVYRDTLRYASTNCDSLYRIINLIVQPVQTAPVTNAVICSGQTYTLPWGAIVNATGIYRDTLHYINTGCDSLRRTINLTVQAATTLTNNPVICQGQTFTLPWGVVTNTAGTYKDTLRYMTTNCDSLYRIINLSVIPAATSSSNATICQGEVYLLPWGINATVSGIYRDTLRSVTGCDSLVRTVNLTVKPKPTISISKSNDINCFVGTAKLYVSGAVSYVWSPAGTLSNPTISNPLATPTTTTIYTVQATGNNGCVATDSIRVIVDNSNTDISFQLPSAFTPNGDGKNDCFGVRTWGNVSNLKLQIYNRWGELVFASTDPTRCWDGTFKGVMQSTAVFVYQVTAETICGKIYRNGTVTLLR